MSNGDFCIKLGFITHYKTRLLLRALGPKGCWSLLCLWSYTAGNKPTGKLGDMAEEDIEIAAFWEGEPGKLINELKKLRFIEVGEDGGYVVHNWEEHNPYNPRAARRVGGFNKQWQFTKNKRKKIRASLEYKNWRDAVLKRDNYTCQDCGLSEEELEGEPLVAHHIKSFTKYPDLRFDVSNGTTLCRYCHIEEHTVYEEGVQ